MPRNLTLICFLTVSAVAQTWRVERAAANLERPTGILLAPGGLVYFSEVPTPGVPGTMGGRNRIAALDPTTGTITTVNMGEPEPLNLAMLPGGDLLWTCRSAGVILRRSGGTVAPLVRMLESPTGITALADGTVVFTLVPTPGVPGTMGGRNSVASLAGMTTTTLNMGEPEPVDVAATPNGDLWWTCRTAGVILRRTAATGVVAPALRGLARPTGIAADGLGNLYFTEVPTPGVPGARGGQNRVWKYAPARRDLTLISMGEPEPTDITVSADGTSVWWTCTSAGVILHATATGPAPTVSTPTATPGATLRSLLHAPMAPGAMYLAASSTQLGGIALPGGRGIGLRMDSLFYGTFLDGGAPAAAGYVGLLDGNGMGTAHLVIPNDPMFVGSPILTAFLTIDPVTLGVGHVSATQRTMIQ